MDKKSQFVVVALPAAAQGATVAAQCSVESRYPYVYLALRRTLYHKYFLKKKIFPSLQESRGKIFRKYQDLLWFLIVLSNRTSQFSFRRNLIVMVLKQRPF
jgi:hypothetical protein